MGGDYIMLDLEEWALVLSKMLRFHFNISEEIKTIVQTIRVEMKPELISVAEEKTSARWSRRQSGRCGPWSMRWMTSSISLPTPLETWISTIWTLISSRT